MAFRYPLQSILRLRRSLEHQEEQRLFASAAVVNRLRAEIEALQQRDLALRRSALTEMQEFSSGAQMQFRAHGDAAAVRALDALKMQLKNAELRRLEQLKVYQQARQRREILESLRERQYEAYQCESARRQQQTTDEAYLAREFGPPCE
jgi:flagellar export protein FliJ